MGRNVLVIGSGLAGTLIANNLLRKHDVTVLEAGRSNGYEYPHVRYLKKAFGHVPTFCYGEGGTTNLWHNGLMPLRPEDVEDFRFKEILREAAAFSDRAADSLFFPTPHFSTEYQSLIEKMSRLNEQIGLFAEGIDCLLYPRSYRGLRIAPGARTHFGVTDIDFSARGRSVERVHFTSGSARHSVDTDTVVISGGSLGTPVLVSRVLAALGHSNSTAGQGLMDHPMGFVGKVRVREDIARAFRELSSHDCGSYECCTAGRLKHQSHLAAIYVRPALTMDNSLALYKYKSILGASRGTKRIRAAISARLFHPDVLAEIYSHLLHTAIRSNIFSILVFFEQKRGPGFVTSQAQELSVSWDIQPHELDIYNNMLRRLHDLFAPVADELTIETPIDESWLWSGAHHSGTISLGDGDDDIVNSDLRIRRSDNVYVCDGSIIQEHSYANTGLTIGQLAYRLTAMIE